MQCGQANRDLEDLTPLGTGLAAPGEQAPNGIGPEAGGTETRPVGKACLEPHPRQLAKRHTVKKIVVGQRHLQGSEAALDECLDHSSRHSRSPRVTLVYPLVLGFAHHRFDEIMSEPVRSVSPAVNGGATVRVGGGELADFLTHAVLVDVAYDRLPVDGVFNEPRTRASSRARAVSAPGAVVPAKILILDPLQCLRDFSERTPYPKLDVSHHQAVRVDFDLPVGYRLTENSKTTISTAVPSSARNPFRRASRNLSLQDLIIRATFCTALLSSVLLLSRCDGDPTESTGPDQANKPSASLHVPGKDCHNILINEVCSPNCRNFASHSGTRSAAFANRW